MTLTRVQIENTIEEKILTYLITNDIFCKEIVSKINLNYFKVDYIRTVTKWIIEYFNNYEKSPKEALQDIFEVERDNLDSAEANLIAKFLSRLSEEFIKDCQKDNILYFINQTKSYFKKRMIKNIADKIILYTDRDLIDDAENELINYKGTTSDISNIVFPFQDERYMTSIFNLELISDREVFKFPGKLGEIAGPWKRGQVYCILGRFKGGKSLLLQEISVLGTTSDNPRKVAYFSLEMSKEEIGLRIFKRIMSMPEEDSVILYPVFDCLKNQNAICNFPQSTNRIGLEIDKKESNFLFFNRYKNYVPCTYCRYSNSNEYKASVWYQPEKRSAINLREVRKKMKGIVRMYGNNLAIISYPMYSAGLKKIISDLNSLEYENNFVPDIIVIDYANILAPDNKILNKIEKIDEDWKNLKQLAANRQCLVISAHQSTRTGLGKKSLQEQDMSGFIDILGHVDGTLAINQDDYEKERGMMRIAVLGSRGMKFNKMNQVLLLQQLDTSQMLIDSEYYFDKEYK